MDIRNQTFGPGMTVETDGRRFVECNFDGAELIYAGGIHPEFENCAAETIAWRFAGDALRTVQFLQKVNAGGEGPAFIADLFAPGKYLSG